MPLRILLAEDHGLVRAGIRSLLQDFPEYTVVGEAATGIEALQLIQSEKPDIVLIDIAMPELNGLEVLARRAREFPDTKVIILSMYSTAAYVVQARRSGASGYLLKGAAVSELDLALKAAARGGFFVSAGIAGSITNVLHDQNYKRAPNLSRKADPYETLTPRQRQVLQLIAEGYSTKAIAERMGISPKTAKTFRAQIMRQLDIHDVAGLVRYAVQVGIVKVD